MAQTITNAAEAAKQLRGRVERAKDVVFFGGAGVSTASGIPDFKSPTGLYNQHFSTSYISFRVPRHPRYAAGRSVTYGSSLLLFKK